MLKKLLKIRLCIEGIIYMYEQMLIPVYEKKLLSKYLSQIFPAMNVSILKMMEKISQPRNILLLFPHEWESDRNSLRNTYPWNMPLDFRLRLGNS